MSTTRIRLPRLSRYSNEKLQALDRLLMQEYTFRWKREKQEKEHLVSKERFVDSLDSISNFLLGCAHAMACRYALRWAAGHKPVGTKPMSGEMWHAWDGADLTDRVSTEAPPRSRNAITQNTYLVTNPLLWQGKAGILAGLKYIGIRQRPSYSAYYR